MLDAIKDAIEKTKEEKSHMKLSGNPRDWMIGDALNLVLHGMEKARKTLLDPNIEKTVYSLVIDDRHTDPEVRVFLNDEHAIKEAERIANKRSRSDYELEEEDIDEWLYFCRFSNEGDCLWVEKSQVEVEDPFQKFKNQND